MTVRRPADLGSPRLRIDTRTADEVLSGLIRHAETRLAMNVRQRLGLARMSQETRAGIGAALVLLAIISLVELADGGQA